MSEFLFTSESVTEGHPDKVADQISDGVLDAVLRRGSARAASPARCSCTTGLVVVAGEITTDAYVDIPRIVREIVGDIGYTARDLGFDCRDLRRRGRDRRAVARHPAGRRLLVRGSSTTRPTATSTARARATRA